MRVLAFGSRLARSMLADAVDGRGAKSKMILQRLLQQYSNALSDVVAHRLALLMLESRFPTN